MPSLPHGELVTWPRLGHTLKPVLAEALDRAAAFILALPDPSETDSRHSRAPRPAAPSPAGLVSRQRAAMTSISTR